MAALIRLNKYNVQQLLVDFAVYLKLHYHPSEADSFTIK